MTSDPGAAPSPPPDAALPGALPPLGPNPFVGPRPYQGGERLYGRRQETRALYYLLSAERIVWLHSPSGAGKTSLVRASLTPRLAHDGFAVCPPVRVNLDLTGFAERVPGANPYIMSALLSLEERLPETERRGLEALAETGLAAYLKALAGQHREEGRAGTVLVLDQFEEVLTVHPLDRPAKEAFFQALGEALRDPNLWALFVLREEYLAALEPYVDWIPSRWTNTFRLDLLGHEAVLEVLQRAAGQGGRAFTPAAAELLFANLARTRVQQPDGSFLEQTGRHAEPVQLQVVCRRLWEAMPADDRSIDPEDLERFGDVTEALRGYYADSVARISGGDLALERRLRAWFGERLIAAGGTRGQVLKGRGASEGLAAAFVSGLLDAHLIREERRAGATWYELAHDRLIAPILADNADWLAAHLQPFQRQAALWVQQGRPPSGGDHRLRGRTLRDALRFAREHPGLVDEDERRLIEISRTARRARVWTRSLLGLLALVVVAFAGTAWWLMEQAREQERAAWYQVAIGQRKDAVAAAEAGDTLRAAHHWAIAAWRFHWVRRPAESANALLALKFINDRPLLLSVTEIVPKGSFGHAVYSSDGTRLLTWGGDDGTARLWDSASGALLTPPLGHDQPITRAEFSANESRILTWSGDDTTGGTLRFWHAGSGRPLTPPFKHDIQINDAEFSRDASRILTWGKDGARVWDSASGTPLTPTLKHDGAFDAAQFSRDESRILTWGEDGARVWESASGAALTPLMKHDGNVWGAQFNRDGSRILTWGRDYGNKAGTARLWDARNGAALTPPLRHDGSLLGARFNRDESRILTWSGDWATNGAGATRLWDAGTGAALTPLLKHERGVSGARLSRDESHILTWGGDVGDKTGNARLWNVRSGEPLTPPLKHDHVVSDARFSEDESRILTRSADGVVRLWDSASGTPLTPPLKHDQGVEGARLSPDELRILTWSKDGTTRSWDAGGIAHHTRAPIADEAFDGVRLSPDESRVVTWGAKVKESGAAARLWDSRNGAALTQPLKHDEAVRGAEFSPDGSRILTLSGHGTAWLWDSLSGSPRRAVLKNDLGVAGARFSHDGLRVVTWSHDGTARLWDSTSGTPLTPVLKHKEVVHSATMQDMYILGMQFSRNDSRILTWGEYSACLWDSASGAPLTQSLEHDGMIRGARFSQDESRILTWSNDGAARLWDAGSGKPLTPPLKKNNWITGASFSRDESRILTWDWGGVHSWDSATGTPLAVPIIQGDYNGILYNQSETRILTWDWDSIRLWDSASGKQLIPPIANRGEGSDAQFIRNELCILAWSNNDTARLWDSASGAPLSPPLPHDHRVGPPRVDPAGKWLRTWTPALGLRTWSLEADTEWPIGKWPLRVEVETGTLLTPIGELQVLPAADWTRKRFCEYDAIRHDLKRLSDAEWADAQRRCRALDQPAPTPTTH